VSRCHRPTVFERVVGSVVGGALGDGWGRPFEGSVPQGQLQPPDELVITDDTQLTLATCEAVMEGGAVAPANIAERFLVWFRAGRLRGLGASTLKALRDLDAGAHWALSGAKGERAAGNGAAMRIAPLAFLLDLGRDEDRRTLRDVCRITHHHDEAYVGGLAVATAVRLVSQPDYAPANLPGEVAAGLPDSQVRDRLVRFAAFGDDVSPCDIGDTWGSSGFVADSVPLAIFAARDAYRRPFAEILERTIAAGGDTDTMASIAGQIAGAALGSSALPEEMVARLRDRDEILRIADGFGRVAASAGER
jgi:ADP-ribosyl-[dinitrogen reductase] hydrolase